MFAAIKISKICQHHGYVILIEVSKLLSDQCVRVTLISSTKSDDSDESTAYIVGIEARLQDIRAGKERHLVAQVLHNWYTLPNTLHLWPISFLTTHEAFVPSSVVLKPNILLLSYGRHEVRLLELSEDCDMFNLNKNPLMAMAQVLHT